MNLMLESVLICKMSNYTAKGLETILEVKLLKLSLRKEQDRLAGKKEIAFDCKQAGNRAKFGIRRMLDKMRMLR